MPRKAFQADLQILIGDVNPVNGISHVRAGSDDGEVIFCLTPENKTAPFRLQALIQDLSEYPDSHAYNLFAADDETPHHVAAALESISDRAVGRDLFQLLNLISKEFVVQDNDGDFLMSDVQSDIEDDEEEEDFDEDDDDFFGLDFNPKGKRTTGTNTSVPTSLQHATSTLEFRNGIRSDFRAVKKAGFKIGYHGGLLDGSSCFISVACRISKLGISDEAMQAWQIDGSDYLLLLVQYPIGYKSTDTIRSYEPYLARQNVQFRVGVCSTYKPTLQEAYQAFATMSPEEELRKQKIDSESQGKESQGFRNVFISRSLNDLLNERIFQLIKFRSLSMDWSGAEAFYNENQGKNFEFSDSMDDKYLLPEPVSVNYPPIVTADHLKESEAPHSLPLVVFQYLLRHFVRCTEFCLVCHNHLDTELEAIKPYVCDKPLCLYQYMSLGFGFSIEHEITSQPYVVDLLISFCYASAQGGKLNEFPLGLSLSVPLASHDATVPAHLAAGLTPPATDGTAKGLSQVIFDRNTNEMIFQSQDKCPFRVGDWVLLTETTHSVAKTGNVPSTWHCRVVDITSFPNIKCGPPVESSAALADKIVASNIPAEQGPHLISKEEPYPPTTVTYDLYAENFDELKDELKRQAIIFLLNLLPSVKEMKEFLESKPTLTLINWSDRIPPAALGLLRWIIASSRACIVQVDTPDEAAEGEKKGRAVEERVHGMQGYMQFRFAMGAPDKEQRFLNAVNHTAARLNLQYPTLFAWHGSPLKNWHSIIREGLHFKDVSNGRAFGNGCYHSLQSHTSLGYSGYHVYGSSNTYWPSSALKISNALALNEIVNAPLEFVSHTPHLVVAQLDWIQTRYLFVQWQGNMVDKLAQDEPLPSQVHTQDPSMTPVGTNGAITIPANAVHSSRRLNKSTTTKAAPVKKTKSVMKTKFHKVGLGSIFNPITVDDVPNGDVDFDDAASIKTAASDLEVFLPEKEPEPIVVKGKGTAMTDFVPGSLDFSTLPLMQEPSFATPMATRRLQKDFQALLKLQNTTPLHELGWYIDPENLTNFYQWIVELHSFDSTLPLAKDMKDKKMTSIVMEMRFGSDYPMSPPFIRIITPRFLDFNSGGGGHVTMGGALCMELLTNNGWSAVSTIEAVLLQVRLAISSTDPKPARLLQNGHNLPYGIGEAVEAYIRACARHGWNVPTGFRETAYGGGDASTGFR